MRTISTSTVKTVRAAAAIVALAVAAASPARADELRTVPFGKTGHWSVTGVHDAQGFNHCAARVSYRNGIQLGLLGYFNGSWTVQFYREDWAERPVSMFDVRVDVDGRTVLSGKGKWSGKSAFVYVTSQSQLAALMNGNLMTVVTDSGSTQFRLDGSAAATRLVTACRQQQMAQNPRQGESKSASNGAFAPPAGNTSQPSNSAFAPPPAAAKPGKLSRAETISYADAYLRQRGLAANLISEDANVMKHFPVNWRMANGIVGGAMVLRGASVTPAAAADRLLNEQRELCKGTLAAANRSNAAMPTGTTVELASVQCTGAAESYSIVFQVSTSADGLLVVIAELAPLPSKPIAGAMAPAADEL